MNDYFDYWKLLAGLGLFLFAMRQLESALKQLSGKRFQLALSHSTKSPLRSVFAGMVTTTIVQSSSLVSLIVLAFVGAGIIPLVNAIGVVLGSNLGTTFTGWVVATLGFKFNLATFIYPMMAVAGLAYGLLKGQWQSFALFVLGLALLLMGLDFMKDSASTLTEQVDISLLSGYPLIVYLLLGTVLTAIIQSSSAVMMLTLSALYAGIIPLPEAAALVIGADLGTTSTVILGSMQGTVAKRRLAMAHVLFNLFVDALAFAALLPLLKLIAILNITDPLYGLVAFHSLFNLFGILLFMPFIKKFAQFLQHWIKTDEQQIELYIHSVPEDVTDAALEALTKETRHLLYLVMHLNLRFLQIDPNKIMTTKTEFSFPKQLLLSSHREHYIAIKKLEGKIINYALKIKIGEESAIKSKSKTDQISHRIDSLMKAIRSGVYSAKSLKDIDENLNSFNIQNNDTLTKYFDQLKASAESFYLVMYTLLNDQNSNALIFEELQALKEKSEDFHHAFAHKIYKKMSGIHLTSLDLSTSLNVNKEMETSEGALIKALELF
ncbi:MAG: Na/Pi cotransporter family protein [Alcanivoracaceae bacterium]|nr:Na/Pi cotransporter family protein [Alcanivoracaceae bacterium]